MSVKDSLERVTDATAERQYVARQIEERAKAPLNVTRKGGYFLSSAGIPTDCEGLTIPEAEWTTADLERLKGAPIPEAGTVPAPVRHGADVVEGSGSEHRAARKGKPAPAR
jgi:hypothetical protein